MAGEHAAAEWSHSVRSGWNRHPLSVSWLCHPLAFIKQWLTMTWNQVLLCLTELPQTGSRNDRAEARHLCSGPRIMGRAWSQIWVPSSSCLPGTVVLVIRFLCQSSSVYLTTLPDSGWWGLWVISLTTESSQRSSLPATPQPPCPHVGWCYNHRNIL